jgi:hypothetical protein
MIAIKPRLRDVREIFILRYFLWGQVIVVINYWEVFCILMIKPFRCFVSEQKIFVNE